ncbi:hypothetical protein Pmani_039766 [Petrolisthes manimaculis]|uniref:Uncharacterized protein n=1 Tax=Petrolisthes manimaculis TaxID=1843537 RepID=A0AAE1NBX5_9EUCA|nr:hypothetical protein Pmani_039766 [Petrolisthes manimaculis]
MRGVGNGQHGNYDPSTPNPNMTPSINNDAPQFLSTPQIPQLTLSPNTDSPRYFSRPMTLEEWQGQLIAREKMLEVQMMECDEVEQRLKMRQQQDQIYLSE